MSAANPITESAEFLAMMRRMIAAAGRRVANADPDDLALLVDLHEALDDAIVTAVVGQRSAGITWQSIGEATGTTRQAAIMKWAPKAGAYAAAQLEEQRNDPHERGILDADGFVTYAVEP